MSATPVPRDMQGMPDQDGAEIKGLVQEIVSSRHVF